MFTSVPVLVAAAFTALFLIMGLIVILLAISSTVKNFRTSRVEKVLSGDIVVLITGISFIGVAIGAIVGSLAFIINASCQTPNSPNLNVGLPAPLVHSMPEPTASVSQLDGQTGLSPLIQISPPFCSSDKTPDSMKTEPESVSLDQSGISPNTPTSGSTTPTEAP